MKIRFSGFFVSQPLKKIQTVKALEIKVDGKSSNDERMENSFEKEQVNGFFWIIFTNDI